MKELGTAPFVDGLQYGEGPRWHEDRLWLSDVRAGRVLAIDDDGKVEVMAEIEGASGLGWLPDGRLVVSTLGQATLHVVDDGEVRVLHDLTALGWSLNDMVVGPGGRIYVDVYRRGEPGQMPPGDIVLATEDSWRIVARDLVTPNGIAITPDGSTLVVSETFSGKIQAFTISDDGDLIDKRVFADLGPERQLDGLCLDAEGAVWVGSVEACEFLRVREGGEVTHRIPTPGHMAVATALGGPDRRTLHLVINHTTSLDVMHGESSGFVARTRVDVPGAGWP